VKNILEEAPYKVKNIPRFRYTRGSLVEAETRAKEMADQLKKGTLKTKAIVMVCTYKVGAAFIKTLRDEAKEKAQDLIFANVSFVGSEALLQELKERCPEYAPGVIVSQVVPHPMAQSGFCIEYRKRLQAYSASASPSFVSFEGYIVAMIFAEAVKKNIEAQKEIGRKNIIESMEQIKNWDFGLGVPISYSQSDHEGSTEVWGTVIEKKEDKTLQFKELKW
jgi:ABC-type branched-subunit amino acid transport system substrate-binding protein